MKRKKEDILVIAFAVILLIIVSVISFIALSPSEPSQKKLAPTPSPTPSQLETPVNQDPPVLYNETEQEKLMDKLEHRQPISSDDAFAKAKILALLPSGENSGILLQTNNIIIDYTASADEFQVEILTTNISQAKAEANVWFRSQGMSQQGICNDPVNFYLNWDVAEQLRGKDINFSPLPNGC